MTAWKVVPVGVILVVFAVADVGGCAAEPTRPAPAPVTLVGHMVCLGCELKLQFGAASDCATNGHLYGLRTDDSNLFTLLETNVTRPLVRGGKYAQQRVQLKGLRFPGSMILEVQEVSPAPLSGSGSADRKTYYCKICAITAYSPGPCVCCGEPVEEVKK